MSTAKQRILFVDDNEDARLIVTTILELSGYEVVTANNTAEALKLAQANSFALFLLDNRLPDAPGLELCRQIRSVDQLTPIVFYSGESREIDQQLALSAGAQAFLIKPIGAEQLTQTVTQLINGKK